jgi:hypothetical protein
MDQTDHVANTENLGRRAVQIFRGASFDAQPSLIDSVNEFAYLIKNHQQ